MVGPLDRIGRDLGHGAVDQPVADRVHHRLILGHGVADEVRMVLVSHRDRADGRQAGQVGPVGPGQTFQRVGAEVDGTVGGREETKAHGFSRL